MNFGNRQNLHSFRNGTHRLVNSALISFLPATDHNVYASQSPLIHACVDTACSKDMLIPAVSAPSAGERTEEHVRRAPSAAI